MLFLDIMKFGSYSFWWFWLLLYLAASLFHLCIAYKQDRVWRCNQQFGVAASEELSNAVDVCSEVQRMVVEGVFESYIFE